MRSGTMLDARTGAAGVPPVRDLLVLWQHPVTREIIPIGRLSHHGGLYSFVYTRGALDIADFRPLPGLNDLRVRYEASQLPLVFGQRVMDPDRPDYEDYLRSLGLHRSEATPWEQIVHSGGARAGDTLQFMEVPAVANGRIHVRFLANGVRHIPEHSRLIAGRSTSVSSSEHEAALQALSPGDLVLAEAETGNRYDVHATLVTRGGVPLGYIPRFLSSSVRELLRVGEVRPVVVRVGDPGTPPHLRLVLDLDADAPAGFEFDREQRWVPASD